MNADRKTEIYKKDYFERIRKSVLNSNIMFRTLEFNEKQSET